MRAPWLALPLLLFVSACEPERPPTRGEVAGKADSLLRREGLIWGEPSEILPPAPDANGRRWWQLRYQPPADRWAGHTPPFLVIVDDDSGWVRLAPPTYVPRIAPAQGADTSTPAVRADEGPWVLILVQPAAVDAAREGELEREASRLNALAAQTGLHPMFSVRRDRAGRVALLYGWQGDRGIARDRRIQDWIQLRTTWRDALWVDLLATPAATTTDL